MSLVLGDLLSIASLALRVYTAYQDAPGDYRHILEEVKSLHVIIEEGVQHFKSTTPCCSQQRKGKEILQGCQSVLEDLDAFIEEYKGLASASKRKVRTRVSFGLKSIADLRARLISNTILLNGFVQSCSQIRIEDSQTRVENSQLNILHLLSKMQAELKLNNILLLQQRDSMFLPDLVPPAGSINSREAEALERKMHQIGVRGDMIKQVLDIFRHQSVAMSSDFGSAVQSQTANDHINNAVDIAVKEEGQSQVGDDNIVYNASTTFPTSADTILSSKAMQCCVFCLSLGALLAGAWVAGFPSLQ